jgi:hypothetical protein
MSRSVIQDVGRWRQIRSLFGLVVTALALGGCDSGESRVEDALQNADKSLKVLGAALDKGTIRNATIIRQYAGILKASRPELAPLLVELEKESTTQGPLFKSLRSRFQGVRDQVEQFPSWKEKHAELVAIIRGADLSIYNDALSDTVNVIADLSKGELARVNAISREAEQKMNKSTDYGPGSQYIGNPQYGRWSQGSGGSFWAWYGQYAFFSNMFGGRRYYYNDWGSNRGYSYYSDYGRNNYTSRSQRASQRDVDNRARKKFGSKGTYKSPYSKSRAGSSGISRNSTAQQKSLFKSQYAKGGKASKFQSTSRNSSYRTSRGVSRGK